MSSRTTRQRPQKQQHRNLTREESILGKFKSWFIKGSQIPKYQTAVPKSRPNQLGQMEATYIPTAAQPYNIGPARPDLVPPRGPRQLPRAVYAEARNDRNEVENESIFSSSNDSQYPPLTSVQSSKPPDKSRSKPSKTRKPGSLRISEPQPTKSLLDLASQYADVQNPQKAYGTGRRPTPAAASNKPPLYNKGSGGGRDKRYQPDQPVKEIPKGRAQVVQPPTRPRSQKTVVRKIEPQFTRRTDDSRQSHVTVFEDFMGKDSPPPVPTLPLNAASFVPPGPPTAHRLSRHFHEASEFEGPIGEDDSENISPTTIPISLTSSHAQTWLRYDGKVPNRLSKPLADVPLFPPRRNMTKPDSNQQYKWNPCQNCRAQIHPSTAVSYNGTYFCQNCAVSAAHMEEEEQSPAQKELRYPYAATNYGHNNNNRRVNRKPFPSPTPHHPLTPSTANTNTLNFSGSTLHGSRTPTPPPQRSPRIRRKDIPPEYAHIYSPDPETSSFTDSTTSKQPKPENGDHNPTTHYTTPHPDGSYPRYRTPPPPPPVKPTTGLRKPAPPSSIYPPDTPYINNFGRLSRTPSLPQHPALKSRMGRSGTLDSDRSYRAAREEEVIDAYAGERSPVSPITEGGRGREKERSSAVSSVYEGVGWRRRR
ncbi:MAG: hypothetical protein LQ338_006919 [Usnochroma carphineum]|nr:MAG: hypothetical protein LQ338_006919 [Usnochroma carphineum]